MLLFYQWQDSNPKLLNPCTLSGSDSAEEFSGSEGEQAAKKKEKAARKAARIERKKTSKPTERSTTTTKRKKKKTKLPGQPKKPMSAYFMWLNSEGRERVKVRRDGVVL